MTRVPLGPADESAEQWVADWAASISARAEAARALADRVAALSSVASSGDGAVRVTVASSGAMTGLDLDDRVLDWPADRIAAEILTTMHRAQSDLAAQAADTVADTVGRDSETGRAVVAGFQRRFPEAPADDGAAGPGRDERGSSDHAG
ncbi:MAG: YbaB/EbfC family nucleoid-associated protein [Dactylosporangium sp.]|nr:YbaB/EbfC family nucleoid-associated protein [Dactylosporangium sp.]NNJ62659.1 YbaB/EbfC family nucleoid-associated protein [Dactylosporangium sp.]